MPFCRECGKQIEDDWVSCPFCSQPIEPPASAMSGVQDSVVMGDINISAYSDADKKCSNCKAEGSVRLACVNCSESYSCNICKEDYWWKLYGSILPDEIINPGNSDSYAQWDEPFIGTKFENHPMIKQGQLCIDCFVSIGESICNKECTICKRKYVSPVDPKLLSGYHLDNEDFYPNYDDGKCIWCNMYLSGPWLFDGQVQLETFMKKVQQRSESRYIYHHSQ